ncbi:hypothetical protein NXW13_23435 [Bacteroides thetaiotaomicron]|nr:hypothetical protein [Bacteroides thetaiotaomicron]
MGTKVFVQGDINTNAAIIATCDGTASSVFNTFVRWIITDGVLGSPLSLSVNGVGYWGSPCQIPRLSPKELLHKAIISYPGYDPNVRY